MNIEAFIKSIINWTQILYKYKNRPKLVIYFDSEESYHHRYVPEQNNAQALFCHLMVKNIGREVAKACKARVVGLQVMNPSGTFISHPSFLNPFILKWAHEDDFSPRDIEPDIPKRLDLCYGLENHPAILIFFTVQKPDGNRTAYTPGTYKVKIRVNADNSKTVDNEFIIKYDSWNNISITDSDKKVSKEIVSKRSKPFYKKTRVWVLSTLGILATLATIGGFLFGDNIVGRLKTKIHRDYTLTKIDEEEIAKKIPELSLRNILKDINNRPLAQQDETGEYYHGTTIKRELLEVDKIEVNPGDKSIYNLSLVLPYEQDSYNSEHTILCTVPVDQYPKLKMASKGMKLYVSGKLGDIWDVFKPFISLDEVTLEFE